MTDPEGLVARITSRSCLMVAMEKTTPPTLIKSRKPLRSGILTFDMIDKYLYACELGLLGSRDPVLS